MRVWSREGVGEGVGEGMDKGKEEGVGKDDGVGEQSSHKIALLIKHFIYKGRFMVLSRRQQVL